MRPQRDPTPRPTLLVALLLCAVAGCDGGMGPAPVPSPVGLRVSPDAPSLRLAESMAMSAEFVDEAGQSIAGASGPLVWSSSDSSVIDVTEDGVVHALAVGHARVQVTSGSLNGGTDVTVLSPTGDVGANTPVSATIDSTGGVIDTTSDDGVRYTLTLPAYAVREPVQITMTPLADVADFPMAAGAAAAVRLEPDGLSFLIPGELQIVTPWAQAAAPVGYTHGRDDFRLIPARVRSDTLRLTIAHFSSAGAGEPTAAEVAGLGAGAGSAEDRANHEMAAELSRAEREGDAPDVARLEQSLAEWYDASVKPGLDAAAAGTKDTEEALGEYVRWLSAVQLLADGGLAADTDAARDAAIAALHGEIDRLNAACAEQNDMGPAWEVMRLGGLAALLGMAEDDDSLSLDALGEDMCVQVQIVEATLPDPFEAGGTLEVRAGLSIGGRAPTFDSALDIELSPTGGTVDPERGSTDGSGQFTAGVELNPGESHIDIDIEAVYPAMSVLRASSTVSADAQTELELTVNGSNATTVDTGDDATLNVSLSRAGSAYAGGPVTLALNGGGSLSSSSVHTGDDGLAVVVYTAPEEADTVTVIATFAAETQQLADTVTITVEKKPEGRVEIVDMYISWGVSAVARQTGETTMTDEDDEWIDQPVSLFGSYSATAGTGSAIANGSVFHSSEVALPDTTLLLMVLGEGSADGVTGATLGAGAGATLGASTGGYITFEVLDDPVFYEMEASGRADGAGRGSVRLVKVVPGDDTLLFEHIWVPEEGTAAESGWLAPGIYEFDGGASVLMGSGTNASDGNESAQGAVEYTMMFRIVVDAPDDGS